jgi:uncharacterized protein YdeI (YjbR/CyaY-like superfamily)
MEPVTPKFFRSGAEFRRWLARNHAKAPFLWLGFWKKGATRKGITYAEAVDEALCFGWIDGHVKGRDQDSYVQRFTPRRPRSIWSAINIRKVERLEAAGRMARPGLATFESRDPKRAGLYSFENRGVTFSPEIEKRFQAKARAWKFFCAQPPGYRRVAAFWVMNAKQEETRKRRLALLVAESAQGRRLASISAKPKVAHE